MNNTVEVKTEQRPAREIYWVSVAAMAWDAGQYARAQSAAAIAQAIALEKLAGCSMANALQVDATLWSGEAIQVKK